MNESIEEFIFTSERNVQIAAAIAGAWPMAQGRAVNEFLARLCTHLVKKLGPWKFENYKQFFVDGWPNVSLWKQAWEGRYYITLQGGNFGRVMQFGIFRDESLVKKKHPYRPELLVATQQLYPSARTQEWWEALVNMKSPAEDWTKPEMLWKIRQDPIFFKDVAEQLLVLAKAVEPILDKLTKKA